MDDRIIEDLNNSAEEEIELNNPLFKHEYVPDYIKFVLSINERHLAGSFDNSQNVFYLDEYLYSLSKSDIQDIKELIPLISNKAICARLCHIVWEKDRDFQFALNAILIYIELFNQSLIKSPMQSIQWISLAASLSATLQRTESLNSIFIMVNECLDLVVANNPAHYKPGYTIPLIRLHLWIAKWLNLQINITYISRIFIGHNGDISTREKIMLSFASETPYEQHIELVNKMLLDLLRDLDIVALNEFQKKAYLNCFISFAKEKNLIETIRLLKMKEQSIIVPDSSFNLIQVPFDIEVSEILPPQYQKDITATIDYLLSLSLEESEIVASSEDESDAGWLFRKLITNSTTIDTTGRTHSVNKPNNLGDLTVLSLSIVIIVDQVYSRWSLNVIENELRNRVNNQLISKSDQDRITRILLSYNTQNFDIIAPSLFIYTEKVVREFMNQSGLPIYSNSANGANYNYRTLNEMIDNLISFYPTECFWVFLKNLLVEESNYRNDIMHGRIDINKEIFAKIIFGFLKLISLV